MASIVTECAVGVPHRDAERAFWSTLARDSDDTVGQCQHCGVAETIDIGDPDSALHQGGGDQERLGELRLDHLGRAAFDGAGGELVGVAGGVGLDRHRCDVVGRGDPECGPCRQCRIDRGVQWPAAGIGLVAQCLAAKDIAEVAQ